MAGAFSFIGKLFGAKTKTAKPAGVRTITNGKTWGDVVEAFNNYPNGTSKTALKVAAVFACNDRISKDIASLPFRPTERTNNGYEIARGHDMYFISHSPSPLYTKSAFFYTLNSHINLWGNGFAKIHREGGRPVMFEILHPSCVTAQIEGNRLYWVYKKDGKIAEIIPDENMIHGMWYTDDGIIGKSVLTYARDTVTLASNSTKMSSDMYQNGMWSPGYISYKGPLSQESVEMIENNWSNKVGEENSGHINVLDNGSEFKSYGMSMHDAEYVATKDLTNVDIARFFGVPPSKIGIRNGNVSYNSLEQENIAYVQDTILPRVVMWEEEFDRKCLREVDLERVKFKFELKSRLRGDMAARSAFYQMGLSSGLLSINDVLKLEDMNTIGKEGDERYVNGAMVPLSKIYSGELENEKALRDLLRGANGNGHAKQVQHQ